MPEILDVRISGDPDDAFAWWGIMTGRVRIPGVRCRVVAESVHANNVACIEGEPDVAAISAASYPACSGDYTLLSPGASVGRGCGPALIAQRGADRAAIVRGEVAVAGANTTGGILLGLLFPSARPVEATWQDIPRGVSSGRFPAGVAIHETLMMWEQLGLQRVECLGSLWTRETALPLPVGLVVANRRLGPRLAESVATALRESVLLAFRRRAEALDFADGYSVGGDRPRMEAFVDRFTNADTVELGADALVALRAMFSRMRQRGLISRVPELDPVQPRRATTSVEVA